MTIQDYKDAALKLNEFHLEMCNFRLKAKTHNSEDIWYSFQNALNQCAEAFRQVQQAIQRINPKRQFSNGTIAPLNKNH